MSMNTEEIKVVLKHFDLPQSAILERDTRVMLEKSACLAFVRLANATDKLKRDISDAVAKQLLRSL